MEIENQGIENQTDVNVIDAAASSIDSEGQDLPASEPTMEEGTSDLDSGAAKEWEPDYSFKVRDEVHQMDEWVKGLAKDEDTLKNFQDLYTRGHGLELAKTERDEVKQKYATLEQSLNTVTELVKNGDTAGFIQALGLPKKMFIDYAINELKFQELPPEQQQQINAQRQQQQYLQNLEMQNQNLQSTYETQRQQMLNNELNMTLSSSYQNEAQSYDARTGVPGSFRQLVIERGIFHDKVHGNNISVEQAIQEAISISGVQSGTAAQAQPNSGTNTVKQKKQMLPNIQGQGTSPAKASMNSLQDVLALRKSKYGF